MTPAEIASARKALGLTQPQLAEVMGLGHGNRVSDWERGVKDINPQAARLLAAYISGYRPDDWPARK